MTKAFLDTTVLADALLKIGPDNKQARASFKRYEELLVSGYAVKEFKAGPLRGYVWLHNKVVTSNSWSSAVASIPSVWQHRNLNMTATRVVADFQSSMALQLINSGAMVRNSSEANALMTKEARVWLKGKIIKAWRDQRKAPFKHISPLTCYAVVPPAELPDGRIDNHPLQCTLGDCCLRLQFTANLDATYKLEQACKPLAMKPEMSKRRAVLRDIRRKPKALIDHNDCLKLGDAVFALQCPPDAVVLSTNVADHGPLCAALGKTAEIP